MAQATASLAPWFTHPRMAPKWIGLVVVGGLAIWTWTMGAWLAAGLGFLWFFPNEYGVHRWVYHRYAVGPDPPGPARSHIRHHLDPTDLDYIFNDPRFSVTIGVVYLFAAWGLLAAVGVAGALAFGLAAAFSFGNFLALAYYEYVHFIAHRPGVQPWIPLGKALKRMHLWHHYKNEHHWFGVTTRVFDHGFGSYRDPAKVAQSPSVRTLRPPAEHEEAMGPAGAP
ncbi:MAG: sterol desaturase family protein [Thermoplasmatota archaeon]